MKQTLKIIALAAMTTFGLNTAAHAQFGLVRGISSLANQDPDPTIPQPKKKGKSVVFRWQNTPIGTWNPQTLELTFNQTWDEGELAGQPVIYSIDPATGIVTRNDGARKGSMNNDGTIESPNLGTLKFNAARNTVSLNGEPIGTASTTSAHSSGHAIGSFDSKVSPLLTAYLYFGLLISEDQVNKWKAEKAESDAQAAKRRAELQEKLKVVAQGYAEELAKCDVTVEASNFSTIGRVRKGCVEGANFSTIGYIKQRGTYNGYPAFEVEASNFSTIGYIRCTGNSGNNLKWEIEQSNHSTIGRFDGRDFDSTTSSIPSGHYSSGTVEASNYSTIGHIKGTSNPVIAAACYYFFFFNKQN